jgi:galactose mutarotase-like enzyme
MPQVFKLYAPGLDSRDYSNSLPERFITSLGDFRVLLRRFGAGRSAGVEAIEVHGQRAGFCILPTRGMSIWRAWSGTVPFQWQSPVTGPTHPSLVPVWDPSGLGWLEGFDELLVRCGLESNGAPEFDAQGRLRFPLHGRIANLPADSLQLTIDDTAGTLEITGTVHESRLFFSNLKLTSTIRLRADADFVEIEDRVTNASDRPLSHQLLYHINVGQPVLGPGAELLAPASEVVPKTPTAEKAVDNYPLYGPPQVGFAEQVYLMRMQANAHQWSRVLLQSPNKDCGLGLAYDTSTLPYFIQWKNTGGLNDGYVTGLEPATNFPNRRSFEEKHGRTVALEPGQSTLYKLQLFFLASAERVSEFAGDVESLNREQARVSTKMRPDWCEAS